MLTTQILSDSMEPSKLHKTCDYWEFLGSNIDLVVLNNELLR